MKGKDLRSFHCPADRQPFMAIQEKWIRGKKEEVSVVQGSLDPSRPVCGRDRAGKKRFPQTGLGVPEKAPTVQHFITEISVAGTIMGAIIPVINVSPTVGVEGMSSPIRWLFCSGFSFCHRLQEASQLSTEL